MADNPLTLEDIIVPVESLHGPVEWGKLFGNSHPVEIEIGSGKGAFLINAAKANPQTNYLGIEWAREFYKYTADRARRWGLANVRLLRCDARDFLARNVPPGRIRTLHIYFPDPWPKKRHHKRRLFTERFLADATLALQIGGQMHLVSDHREYFELAKNLLAGCSRLQLEDFTPDETAELGEWVGSNFERKYLAQGRIIYSCSARKVAN